MTILNRRYHLGRPFTPILPIVSVHEKLECFVQSYRKHDSIQKLICLVKTTEVTSETDDFSLLQKNKTN